MMLSMAVVTLVLPPGLNGFQSSPSPEAERYGNPSKPLPCKDRESCLREPISRDRAKHFLRTAKIAEILTVETSANLAEF